MATDPDDSVRLAELNNSLKAQRRALESAGSIPGQNGPKRLTFEERLAKLPPAPAPPTAEEILAERQKHALAVVAEREKQIAGHQRWFGEVLGRRYAGCTLENFTAHTPEKKQQLKRIRDYADRIAENVNAGNGLVLIGPPGTGKDHLLIGVLRKAIDAGFRIRWTDGMEFFASSRDTIGDEKITESQWVADFTEPDILAISDPLPPFGDIKEGWQIGKLFQVVNRRYCQQKPTFVSCNVADAKEAAKRMSGQVVDRLSDGALVLACDWESYRRAPK